MDFSLSKFNEALESRAKRLVEAGEATAQAATKEEGWFYFPKKSFLGGTMKPLVREVSADKWEIMFCAPDTGDSKADDEAGDLMASKEISKYINLLSEGTVEGDKASLPKWYVKARWSGSFEDCLKKCVSIVEGKTEAIPSSFKKK